MSLVAILRNQKFPCIKVVRVGRGCRAQPSPFEVGRWTSLGGATEIGTFATRVVSLVAAVLPKKRSKHEGLGGDGGSFRIVEGGSGFTFLRGGNAGRGGS